MNEAKTASNVAGKMIGLWKVKIEYDKMTQSKSKISSLEGDM